MTHLPQFPRTLAAELDEMADRIIGRDGKGFHQRRPVRVGGVFVDPNACDFGSVVALLDLLVGQCRHMFYGAGQTRPASQFGVRT